MIDMVTEQELARNNKDATVCKKMADAATVWEAVWDDSTRLSIGLSVKLNYATD